MHFDSWIEFAEYHFWAIWWLFLLTGGIAFSKTEINKK